MQQCLGYPLPVKKKPLLALIASFVMLFSMVVATSAKAENTNRCLQFDGNSYAEAPARIVPVASDFTVEMWVYSSPSNNGKFTEFISQGGQPNAFYMGVDPNSYLRMGDSWMSTGVRIDTNTWTHIAYTHTTGNLGKLYVNGQLKGTTNPGTNSFNPVATNTRFGAYYWPTAAEFFTGCLDDVRIWSTVRSEKEIYDHKDIRGVSNNALGLIASYSFDTLTGFYGAIKNVYPDSEASTYGTSQMFTVFGNLLKVPIRGTLVTQNIVSDCGLLSNSSKITTEANIPKILMVNARDNRQTSVDLLINGLAPGTCIGMDLFVKGTTEPLTSNVGIVSEVDSKGNTPRFRMNLDTSDFQCSGGTNNTVEVRGWWSHNGQYSQYGDPYLLPTCFGSIPANGSSMVANFATVTLVGENTVQPEWRLQTALRLKNAQMVPAAAGNSKVVSDLVADQNGCHVKVSSAILQKIENAQWVDISSPEDWVLAKNCDPSHPYQPVVKVSLPETTVLRWKVTSSNAWQIFSAPFIHVAGASANSGSATNSGGSTTTDTASTQLETPTNFSVTLQGNELQLRVMLPTKTRSKVTAVSLVSAGLGFLADNPLMGTVESSFGLFRIPLAKLTGKSGVQKVLIDSRGKGVTTSKQLAEEIDLTKYVVGVTPSAKASASAKASVKPSSKPVVKAKVTKKPVVPKPTATAAVNAIRCSKGSIVRTFLAKTCPPGWKNA